MARAHSLDPEEVARWPYRKVKVAYELLDHDPFEVRLLRLLAEGIRIQIMLGAKQGSRIPDIQEIVPSTFTRREMEEWRSQVTGRRDESRRARALRAIGANLSPESDKVH